MHIYLYIPYFSTNFLGLFFENFIGNRNELNHPLLLLLLELFFFEAVLSASVAYILA